MEINCTKILYAPTVVKDKGYNIFVSPFYFYFFSWNFKEQERRKLYYYISYKTILKISRRHLYGCLERRIYTLILGILSQNLSTASLPEKLNWKLNDLQNLRTKEKLTAQPFQKYIKYINSSSKEKGRKYTRNTYKKFVIYIASV